MFKTNLKKNRFDEALLIELYLWHQLLQSGFQKKKKKQLNSSFSWSVCKISNAH